MWIALAGVGGLVVAASIWRYAFALVPDVRGRAVGALSLGRRRAAMLTTLVGGTAGAVVVAAVLPGRPAVVAFVLFAAVSPGLAVIDVVAHRLPFVVSGALGAALVVSFGWDAAWSGGSGPLGRTGWAALVVGGLALIWWRVFDGGVGLGDAALLAVIAAYAGWMSWAAVWGAVTLGLVLAALAAGLARWGARRPGVYMPLGPWLLTGCWVTVALSLAYL